MSPNQLADLFPCPREATRNHRRDGLLQRAQLVRANGRTPYQAPQRPPASPAGSAPRA